MSSIILYDIQGFAESLTEVIRSHGKAWTCDELSKLLSMSKKHLYRMAKEQRLPSFRIGGAVRFDPESVANWLDARTT